MISSFIASNNVNEPLTRKNESVIHRLSTPPSIIYRASRLLQFAVTAAAAAGCCLGPIMAQSILYTSLHFEDSSAYYYWDEDMCNATE